jgi:transcriptional regulator with XRE-family HTH domain
MKNPVDVHIGQRLRHRRWLSGMTQQNLAEAVGIRFQQIQKYESGANRISAARLWSLSGALGVPISFFYVGMNDPGVPDEDVTGNVMDAKETFELLRAYYGIGEGPRRRMLALVQAMNGGDQPAAAPHAELRLSVDGR